MLNARLFDLVEKHCQIVIGTDGWQRDDVCLNLGRGDHRGIEQDTLQLKSLVGYELKHYIVFLEEFLSASACEWGVGACQQYAASLADVVRQCVAGHADLFGEFEHGQLVNDLSVQLAGDEYASYVEALAAVVHRLRLDGSEGVEHTDEAVALRGEDACVAVDVFHLGLADGEQLCTVGLSHLADTLDDRRCRLAGGGANAVDVRLAGCHQFGHAARHAEFSVERAVEHGVAAPGTADAADDQCATGIANVEQAFVLVEQLGVVELQGSLAADSERLKLGYAAYDGLFLYDDLARGTDGLVFALLWRSCHDCDRSGAFADARHQACTADGGDGLVVARPLQDVRRIVGIARLVHLATGAFAHHDALRQTDGADDVHVDDIEGDDARTALSNIFQTQQCLFPSP